MRGIQEAVVIAVGPDVLDVGGVVEGLGEVAGDGFVECVGLIGVRYPGQPGGGRRLFYKTVVHPTIVPRFLANRAVIRLCYSGAG